MGEFRITILLGRENHYTLIKLNNSLPGRGTI